MIRERRWWLASLLATTVLAGAAGAENRPPERVVSLRRQALSRAEYQQRFAQWQEWTKSHPADPVGWAQLARAAMYTQAPCDEWVRYAAKAVEVGPNNAEALATLGRVRWSMFCSGQPDDPSQAIALLERALQLDPSLDDPRYILWTMLRAQGRREEANAQLRALLDQGEIPEPLMDLGYNLLVGLEPNAILLTNGDNDTYPVIALQTARGVRADVSVVNLPMLNLKWFRRELRSAPGPLRVPVPLLEGGEDNTRGDDALRGLIDEWNRAGRKRPLYAAVTVSIQDRPLPPHLSLEGMVYRVLPGGAAQEVDRTVTRRNLEKLYRLESATSVSVNWQDWSSLRSLVTNYAGAYLRLAVADAQAGDIASARGLAIRTLELLDFHHASPEFAQSVLNTWSGWEPKSAEVEKWKKRMNP